MPVMILYLKIQMMERSSSRSHASSIGCPTASVRQRTTMSSANLMVATVVPGRTRTVGSAHRLRLALATWMGSISALVKLKYDVYIMTTLPFLFLADKAA